MDMTGRRLNIGSGPIVRDGWTNVDRDRYPGAVRGDVLAGDLGSRGMAEGAVAHHVLQMIGWPDLVPWLDHVRGALRYGGYLRLSVPDLRLAGDWLDGFGPPPPISDDHEASMDGKVCLWVSQAGATRSVFTGPWLVELCLRAGFRDAAVQPHGCSHGPEWLTSLDYDPDRSSESVYVDARR